MKKWLLLLPVIGFLAIASCSEENEDAVQTQEEKPVDTNPNGSSELALLMRQMFDEGMEMKEAVMEGKRVESNLPYHNIITATPTEERFKSDPDFPVFAEAYIEAMQNLEEASPEEARLHYSTMITTCMSCHQDMCPGPIVKIEKLYLEEE